MCCQGLKDFILNDTGRGKPTLTFGLHKVPLPALERSTEGGLAASVGNVAKSIINGVTQTLNGQLNGEDFGSVINEGFNETGKLADRVIAGEASTEDVENLAAAGVMMLVKGKIGGAKTSSKFQINPRTGGKGKRKNIQTINTDIGPKEFGANLEANGFTKSVSKDGKVTTFSQNGKSFALNPQSKSHGKPSADVRINGSKKINHKIRLEDDN